VQPARAAFDALGAGDDRRARAQRRSDRARGRTQVLRGNRQQDDVVAPDLRADRRDADVLVKPHARQTRTLARLHQRIGAGAITRGEQHRAPRACDRVRERGTPRACADDGDMIEGHGFSGEQFRRRRLER
jgi:hypothetical protein